ncbi:hypothetical protein [Cohnella mopanensis]|uniref:hypothetical protein n=1 Tax=Cohnella mopanensis TaxID=2911966 RepID=UPI001EF7A45E|nr:hypothetical protein [Cohnella mopanensis]
MSKRWIWGGILVTIAVAAGIAWLVFESRHERMRPAFSVVSEPITVTSNDRWTQIDQWQKASSSFATNSNEPIVLYKNGQTKQALYALRGSIFFEQVVVGSNAGKDASSEDAGTPPLIKLAGEQAVYWMQGDHLLIGVALQQNNPESSLRGEWYSVQMKGEAAPEAVRIEEAYQDPRSVLSVTAVDDPALFVLAIADDDRRYREFAYWPGDPSLLSVNVEAGGNRDAAYERFVSQRPEKSMQLQSYRQILSAEGGEGEGEALRALQDERGTLIAAKWGSGNRGVVRYPGYKTEKLVWKDDIVGQRQPLALLSGINDSGSGRQMLSLPFSGSVSVLEAAPELLHTEWRMVDSGSFYTVGNGTVDTIRYIQGDRDDTSFERRHYVTKGSLVEEIKGLLTYETSETRRREFLSVFDLLLGSGDIGQMWLGEPLTLVKSAEQGGEPQIPTVKVKLPQKMWDLSWMDTEVPQEVQKAMEAGNASGESCLFDCDPDFAAVRQIRSIDGVWHVLQDKRLFRLEGGSLKLIGQLPITLRTTIGEGANGYTAQDYIRADGSWYVADTFADRVIRLSDSLEVTGVLELPMPYRLKAVKDGRLEITSLKGTTTAGLERLQVVKQSPADPVASGKLSVVSHEIDAATYYKDPNTGNGWMSVYGNVFMLSKQDGNMKLLRYFIGYPESGRTVVKPLPYKKDIVILSDNRVERLSGGGQWKQTIAFPQDTTDCNGWADGENSYAYDAERGEIYLVHGCSIILIDLVNGTAKPIFSQAESRIGKLAQYGDKILFSVEGDKGSYSYSAITYPYSNELVALDKQSGKIERYQLEKGWVSEGIAGGEGASNGTAILKLGYRPSYGEALPDQPQLGTMDLTQLNSRK